MTEILGSASVIHPKGEENINDLRGSVGKQVTMMIDGNVITGKMNNGNVDLCSHDLERFYLIRK